jgi:hypothetical protein
MINKFPRRAQMTLSSSRIQTVLNVYLLLPITLFLVLILLLVVITTIVIAIRRRLHADGSGASVARRARGTRDNVKAVLASLWAHAPGRDVCVPLHDISMQNRCGGQRRRKLRFRRRVLVLVFPAKIIVVVRGASYDFERSALGTVTAYERLGGGALPERTAFRCSSSWLI